MRRIAAALVLAALGLVGACAGILLPGSEAAPTAAAAKSATTRVTVNAFEFGYKLSRRSVPTGTVIFRVVNKGKIAHDFKIAGKKTPNIAPGKSATLRVNITKKGRYAYLCTLAGHAKNGMKGAIGVAVAAPPPPPPPPPPTGTVGNANTTVVVDMFEYRFALNPIGAPSGNVTFVITNRGAEPHNFSITAVKAGKIMNNGESETWTVALPPRTYEIVCDVPFHIGFGMQGTFTVTP
jgi:uncharacterized cupredoxin-like copper-binding protein